MSFEDIIEDIFSQRAKKISGHDPWRYGEILAKKTDEIEFNWLVNNLEINQNTTIVATGNALEGCQHKDVVQKQ